MIRTPLLLVAALLVTSIAAAAARPPRVRVAGSVSSGQAVEIVDQHGSRTALRLPAWSSVEDVVVSPSHRHALVYAFLRPHEPRTAFVLDLESATVAGSFRPGVGGTFTFSATDTVIQVAGCGTECVTMQLHDAHGRKLGAFVCDGFDDDSEISPDRRFVACVRRDHVFVLDATTGHEVGSHAVPCRALARPTVAFHGSVVRISSACEGREHDVISEAPLPPAPLR